MKFDVLTLFPEMFEPMKQSIIGRALEKEILKLNIINIRDFSEDKHKKVDDTIYGGGAGMLIKPDVVYVAIAATSFRTQETSLAAKVMESASLASQGCFLEDFISV